MPQSIKPDVRSVSTRALAEVSIAIALAAVLSLLRIKLPHLLYGGSVSLHMLPLVVVAVRHGVGAGVVAGAAYGVVNFILTPYFVHPIQLLLDYPVAFACLGVSGLGVSGLGVSGLGISGWGAGHPVKLALAMTAAGMLRMAVHVISGIVYFAELAPEGTPVWLYSLSYNASYMIPEVLLLLLVGLPVLRRLPVTTQPR